MITAAEFLSVMQFLGSVSGQIFGMLHDVVVIDAGFAMVTVLDILLFVILFTWVLDLVLSMRVVKKKMENQNHRDKEE